MAAEGSFASSLFPFQVQLWPSASLHCLPNAPSSWWLTSTWDFFNIPWDPDLACLSISAFRLRCQLSENWPAAWNGLIWTFPCLNTIRRMPMASWKRILLSLPSLLPSRSVFVQTAMLHLVLLCSSIWTGYINAIATATIWEFQTGRQRESKLKSTFTFGKKRKWCRTGPFVPSSGDSRSWTLVSRDTCLQCAKTDLDPFSY